MTPTTGSDTMTATQATREAGERSGRVIARQTTARWTRKITTEIRALIGSLPGQETHEPLQR